jgi:HEAT repeat protein
LGDRVGRGDLSVAASGRRLAEETARRREAALAGHRGDEAAIRPFLDDVDPAVRATALRALARTDALPLSDLIKSAADRDGSVRRTVAELIGRRADPDLDNTLLGLLEDLRADVIEMAAFAAGERERPTEPIVGRLIALAGHHDDALVREAAVAALGAIGDVRGLPVILQATTDRATVRRRAVLALAPFDGDEVDAALQRALDDRDWQVRQAAEDLLD